MKSTTTHALFVSLLFAFGCKAAPSSDPADDRTPEIQRHPITALATVDPVAIWSAMIGRPVFTKKTADTPAPPISATLVAVLVAGKVVAGNMPSDIKLEQDKGTTFVVKSNNQFIQQHYLLGYSH